MEHDDNTPNFKEHSHQSRPKKTRTKFTRFLGCFGFSWKQISFPEEKLTKISIHPERKNLKKQRSWFPWSWFCIKTPGTRTVPLDPNVPDSNRTSNASKSKRQKPLTKRETPSQTPASADRAPNDRLEQTWYRSEQDIILENGKPTDHVEILKDGTCKKRLSFRRKVDAIRTGTNQPGSPEVKEKFIRIASITRSTSSPSQLAREKSATVPNTPGRSRVSVGKPRTENDNPNGKKSDSLVGMSIIITTSLVMLLWGKLCAILCTSALFYFVPRLRSEDNVKDGLIPREFNYDSEEYKKKVVLDGFLERKRRSIS